MQIVQPRSTRQLLTACGLVATTASFLMVVSPSLQPGGHVAQAATAKPVVMASCGPTAPVQPKLRMRGITNPRIRVITGQTTPGTSKLRNPRITFGCVRNPRAHFSQLRHPRAKLGSVRNPRMRRPTRKPKIRF